jgi:heterodisulfide reductase subunit A-like polyferredoxin
MKMIKETTPMGFRAEYIAEVNKDVCVGCKECAKVCQFNAIKYSDKEKIKIDVKKCFGCGICRSVCKKDAIFLRNRCDVPEAANLW